MAQSVETPMSQGEANNIWKSTMYNDLIRLYGKPSDVPFLNGTEFAPRYCAEYVLHLGFSGAMPEKIGLIIGKNGNGLKKIQEEVNKVYGGAHTIQWEELLHSDIPNEEIPSSVQAIWAKNLPDGRIAFTAYGRKPNALCRALQMIRDKAITILEIHQWTVYKKAWKMAIILKDLRHSKWSEEKEASEEWNTYSRRYELLVEQDILKTSTHYPSGNPPSHFPEFAEFDKVQDNRWVAYHPYHVLPNVPLFSSSSYYDIPSKK